MLRVLEGYYWPPKLRDWRTRHVDNWFERQQQRFQELALKPILTPKETEELVRLDECLMYMPKESEQRMPTRLGNLLRAVESRPENKYGLNAFGYHGTLMELGITIYGMERLGLGMGYPGRTFNLVVCLSSDITSRTSLWTTGRI